MAGIIKDVEMRSPWVIQVDPKYHDKCPYQKHTKENRERRGPSKDGGGR